MSPLKYQKPVRLAVKLKAAAACGIVVAACKRCKIDAAVGDHSAILRN